MTREANDNDPRVSETYRELATETAPPALDKKILSLAGDNQRSGFGLSRAWFRPIAWAATIGLSLAFVLEMSQLDDVAEPIAHTDADALFEDDSAHQKDVVLEEPEMRSDAAAESIASPPLPAAEVTAGGTDATVSGDFAAADMPLLQEAEEQARARAGSARAVAAHSPAALAAKKEQVILCDDDARSTAASWYACIEELRQKHLDDAAVLELEALLVHFPDFEVPDGDR